MTRAPRKALGLILPLANTDQRARAANLVDDGSITAGVHLVVSTMEPAYSAGDVALVRPCSATAVTPGRDFFFLRKGSKPATYRLLRVERVTPSYIFARQFNPALVRRLPRKTWETAYKVTGKYNRDLAPGAAPVGGAS